MRSGPDINGSTRREVPSKRRDDECSFFRCSNDDIQIDSQVDVGLFRVELKRVKSIKIVERVLACTTG